MISARAAGPDDVDAIVRVCVEGYRRTYPGILDASTIAAVINRFYGAERVADEIAPAPPSWSGYLVAADDDGVGAVGGGGMTSATVGEVFVLYADPDRRGRGFGSAVLHLLTRQQVALGATTQVVAVQEGNVKGIPFYEARGFVHEETVAPWDDILRASGAMTWRMSRPVGRDTTPVAAGGARQR